jgi:hypothetical protein
VEVSERERERYQEGKKIIWVHQNLKIIKEFVITNFVPTRSHIKLSSIVTKKHIFLIIIMDRIDVSH